MTFEEIAELLRRQIQSLDGKDVRHLWISEEEKATLIDPDTGKVAALVWHDGYGKYHPLMFVSPWRAIRLIFRECGVLVSLLAFPRITVELYRLKTDTIGEAQTEVESYLKLDDHI